MLHGADILTAQTEFEAFLDGLDRVFCRCYGLDGAVRLAYVSGAVERWTGVSQAAFVAGGRDWLEQIHPADRHILPEAMERVADCREGFAVDYRLAASEPARLVRHTARCASNDGASPVMWNSCIEDITALRQTQKDLERTQLLQNMGRLAAGIAHEINTPIQFIGDNLHFLAEAWEALCLQCRHQQQTIRQAGLSQQPAESAQSNMSFILSEAPDAIRQSLEGVERIGTLIAAMRDFSHLDERRMAKADLNGIIHSTLTLLRNELKYTVEVHTELDPALSEVYCSMDEISQVMINLLINASHSIREKIDKGLYKRGRIEVRSRHIEDLAEISIADDGMGIPEDIQPRIFERFFTTKRTNAQVQGTGQGLAMVQSIIRQRHHGQVTFETRLGEGTTFRLRIPIGRPSDQEAS